jgi:hypothetical protein
VSPPTAANQFPRALLETTVQIDRRKTRARESALAALLSSFGWKFTTSIVLLEFKAVLIQECITIHNQLRLRNRFTVVRDGLLQSNHPQTKLRSAIFDNMIQVYGGSFAVSPEQDEELAEKARLALENIIPELYRWFVEDSVDSVLKDKIDCTRAAEPPVKKRAAFDTNLPTCVGGRNKWCRVESHIRETAPKLIEGLTPFLEKSEQLQTSRRMMLEMIENSSIELSHQQCRKLGDCLIGLEAYDHVTHAVSTNSKEWEPIAAALSLTFVRPDYSEEKSK